MKSCLTTRTIPDMVCICHLRWDFVYQRPQHLMTRCASQMRVFYVEEPVLSDGPARLLVSHRDCGVRVVVPHVPDLSAANLPAVLRSLLDKLFVEQQIKQHYLWLYTPMAIEWTRHLRPSVVIYDCMDELSAFKNAPADLKEKERELLRWADLVFTGGQTLWESKRTQHPHAYPFPSSIDVQHFARARQSVADPEDQAHIPHPRLGFFGVVDERMDLDLVAGVADARPDWHQIFLGPVVKIDKKDLPARPNIHYLGMKKYDELPSYIATWDVALLPFARNEATRFISPTKTPEYLAAGRPVVSTEIRDVVRPYGEMGLVHIANTPEAFVKEIESALAEDSEKRLKKADTLLALNCWSRTWGRMLELIEDVSHRRTPWPAAVTPRRAIARAATVTGLPQGS